MKTVVLKSYPSNWGTTLLSFIGVFLTYTLKKYLGKFQMTDKKEHNQQYEIRLLQSHSICSHGGKAVSAKHSRRRRVRSDKEVRDVKRLSTRGSVPRLQRSAPDQHRRAIEFAKLKIRLQFKRNVGVGHKQTTGSPHGYHQR